MERGIRVIPRVEDPASWEWGLELTGYGRGQRWAPVEKAHLKPEKNRITYERKEVVEWYVNDAKGLEQGFTLVAPPEERQAWQESRKVAAEPRRLAPQKPRAEATGPQGEEVSVEESEHEGPLVLLLELTGNLSPLLSADADAIDFLTPSGARALRYAELKVEDATGRGLPARMETATDAEHRWIRLVVDDAKAVWPVRIDPRVSLGWTEEGDQLEAEFGFSVATAGDVNGDGYSDVIVGAKKFDGGQDNEGRAFVYHGSASGLAADPAWTAESDQADAHFGVSVATAGDVNGDGYSDVIVGAEDFDNPEVSEGRAYVYHGSAAGLEAAPVWTAESDQANAHFGGSVATAGDVNGDGYSDVIVGALYFDNVEVDEGRAYVYHGSAAGLAAAPAWRAESDEAFAYFGDAVATAGDVNGDGYADVIVGVHRSSHPEANEGRVFVWLGGAVGLGPDGNPGNADWSAETNAADTGLGFDVATAGDVNGDGYADVIVGAPYSNANNGRAYLYQGSAGGLAAAPAWTGNALSPGGLFGSSVGTAGDVNGDGYADVIVGADSSTVNALVQAGAATIFGGSAGGLRPATSALLGTQVDAHFGFSVGTAGDVNGDGYSDVIVGEAFFDGAFRDEGRAMVYHGRADGPGPAAWTDESDQEGALFGLSVGTAGDVNGDGYSDLIVGAPFFDNGQVDEGRAFAYYGSANGLPLAASWTAESGQARALFGYSVGTAGDVNGDGYSDVIVGAPNYSNVEMNEGRAYVYYGSAGGLVPGVWTAESDQANASFGLSVGTAGDVNGDGFSDVIVGAYRFDNPEVDEGRVYVYHGSAEGLGLTANWTAEGELPNSGYGFSVGTAGDVNGDGYSDVIVGAPHWDLPLVNSGTAFAYYGSASGLQGLGWTPGAIAQSPLHLGYSVAAAGDVNADGFSDVIVGAPLFDHEAVDEGLALVFHGSAFGLFPGPDWVMEGNEPGAFFGLSVGTAGDLDGDGDSDVIVGAPGSDAFDLDSGRVSIFLGRSGSGLFALAAFNWYGEDDGSGFGDSVGTAGDVNGDGFPDLFVGSDALDDPEVDEGAAYLFYGNGGDGIDRIPRQVREDGTAPIALLGKSDSEDTFRLRLLGRTPAGRGWVRMESEVVPLGTLFDGTGIARTAVMDTGAPGPGGSVLDSFDVSVTGLSVAGADYKWRVRLASPDPFFPRSPWFSLPYNAPTETDLRMSDVDRDGDGVSVGTGDCNDSDAGAFAEPSEVDGLVVEDIPGGVRLTWTGQATTSGTGTVYDGYSGLVSSLREAGEYSTGACIADDLASASFDYLAPDPPLGDAYYFMLRAQNSCGTGTYGSAARDAGAASSAGPCL